MTEYFVEKKSSGRVNYDVRIQYTHSEDTRFTDPHIHSFVEILYGIEGNYKVIVDGKSKLFSKDDIIIVCSNQVHQIYPVDDPKGCYLVVKFEPEMICSSKNSDSEISYMQPFLSVDNFVYDKPDDEMMKIAEKIIKEIQSCDYAYEIAIKSGIYSMIYWFLKRVKKDFKYRSKDKKMEQLIPALTHIEKNYNDKLTVRELASLSYMDYTTFSKLFKRVMNVDCIKYINNFRIQKSEQLLILDKLSITEIASAVGFDNTCYFIKLFKKSKGVTPVAYRKLYNL